MKVFDWGAYDGESLYWDCDIKGTVIELCTDINLGYGITVITSDKDGIFKHRFWHLKKMNVKVGQTIETGDLIGFCDNTGKSTGTHLHRDIKPQTLMNGIYKNIYQKNGYFGAIDIQPYFKNLFVLDVMENLKQQVEILQKIIDLVKSFFKNKGQN